MRRFSKTANKWTMTANMAKCVKIHPIHSGFTAWMYH